MRNRKKIFYWLYVAAVTLMTVVFAVTPLDDMTQQTSSAAKPASEFAKANQQDNNSLLQPLIKQTPVQESKSEKPSEVLASDLKTKVSDIGAPGVAPTPRKAEEVKQSNSKSYRVSSYQLNVRTKPDAASKIVKTLEQNDIVVATDIVNGWLKLEDGNYVSSRYVTSTDAVPATKPLVSRGTPRTTKPTAVSFNVHSKSGLTAEQFDQILDGSELEGIGDAVVEVEELYNVNGLFTVAVAKLESGHGESRLARTKNNLFGLNAVDGDAYNSAFRFRTKDESVRYFGDLIQRKYISQGLTTLQSINRKYAPTNNKWASKVHTIMRGDYSKIN